MDDLWVPPFWKTSMYKSPISWKNDERCEFNRCKWLKEKLTKKWDCLDPFTLWLFNIAMV